MCCGDCKYWRASYCLEEDESGKLQKVKSGSGSCCRYPPRIVLVDNPDSREAYSTLFPETEFFNFCGEFYPTGEGRE